MTFDYDNLNRMIRKTVPERAGLDAIHTRDVFYGYDHFGRKTWEIGPWAPTGLRIATMRARA